MTRTITITIHRRARPAPEGAVQLPRAAGVLFADPASGEFLLLRRAGGDHAGTWGFPAGKIEDLEDPEEAARRELREETQVMCPPGHMFHVDTSDGFCLYMAVATKFTPILNHEHDDFQWCSVDKLPEPLHPNVEKQLEKAFHL